MKLYGADADPVTLGHVWAALHTMLLYLRLRGGGALRVETGGMGGSAAAGEVTEPSSHCDWQRCAIRAWYWSRCR